MGKSSPTAQGSPRGVSNPSAEVTNLNLWMFAWGLLLGGLVAFVSPWWTLAAGVFHLGLALYRIVEEVTRG